jgi:serine/threonine-protein kinase RsbT
MTVSRSERFPLLAEADVVAVRQAARKWSVELSFNLIDQTKLVTAASELARNTLLHGGGGSMQAELVEEGFRRGLRLTFEDSGRGIPDIELALKDGYTSGGGLGLGLGGSRRLVNDFEIHSLVGEGTRVVITRWK